MTTSAAASAASNTNNNKQMKHERKSPEIELHVYGQVIFLIKVPRYSNKERIVFVINYAIEIPSLTLYI